MISNHNANRGRIWDQLDFEPVVLFYDPDTGLPVGLFTELAPDGQTLFGLFLDENNLPQIDNVNLMDLVLAGMQYDASFRAEAKFSVYAKLSMFLGRIVENFQTK